MKFTLSPCPICKFTEETARAHCKSISLAECLYTEYMPSLQHNNLIGRPHLRCRNCGFTILSDAIVDPYDLAVLWNSLTPETEKAGEHNE